MTMVLVGDPTSGPWSVALGDAEVGHLTVSFQVVIMVCDHERDDDLSITLAGRFRARLGPDAPCSSSTRRRAIRGSGRSSSR
jgi:hypothetical protein